MQELNNLEQTLFIELRELNISSKKVDNLKFKDINESFISIHHKYAELSSSSMEALKRGLFIQWIYLTEPVFLTGISCLNENAEEIIINNLNKLIGSKNLDEELSWMLNHYLQWDYVFEKFSRYEHVNKLLEKKKENTHSMIINKESMESRGIMGKYWGSFQTSNGC